MGSLSFFTTLCDFEMWIAVVFCDKQNTAFDKTPRVFEDEYTFKPFFAIVDILKYRQLRCFDGAIVRFARLSLSPHGIWSEGASVGMWSDAVRSVDRSLIGPVNGDRHFQAAILCDRAMRATQVAASIGLNLPARNSRVGAGNQVSLKPMLGLWLQGAGYCCCGSWCGSCHGSKEYPENLDEEFKKSVTSMHLRSTAALEGCGSGYGEHIGGSMGQ